MGTSAVITLYSYCVRRGWGIIGKSEINCGEEASGRDEVGEKRERNAAFRSHARPVGSPSCAILLPGASCRARDDARALTRRVYYYPAEQPLRSRM